jgi:hypothetical protein
MLFNICKIIFSFMNNLIKLYFNFNLLSLKVISCYENKIKNIIHPCN